MKWVGRLRGWTVPLALRITGAMAGAAAVGWFLIGSAAALCCSLLVGHLAIWIAFALNRTRRRLPAAVLSPLLCWWAAVFGDMIWLESQLAE